MYFIQNYLVGLLYGQKSCLQKPDYFKILLWKNLKNQASVFTGGIPHPSNLGRKALPLGRMPRVLMMLKMALRAITMLKE